MNTVKTIKLPNGKDSSLRSHQADALSNLITEFKEKDRATLNHCCRSGKGLTSVAIHKQLMVDLQKEAFQSAVFLPNISLIQQTIQDWKPNIPKAKILVISCDKTSYDGEVTTNSKNIRKFIKESKDNELVVFCTYQSSKKLCKALSKLKDFSFDFLVADEAHRTAGVSLRQARFVHFDDCIKATKRLYMTATRKTLSRRVKEFSHEDAEKLCMNDSDIFGNVSHSYSFAEAIEDNIISDYEIVLMGCSSQEQVNAIKDRTHRDHASINETAKLLTLENALKDRNVTHCISFHGDVSKALFYKKHFKLKGWKVFHINGEMSAQYRVKVLKSFRKADKALLTNCRCLQEGVNIVECDSLYFPDVKRGVVDVVQSASRCLTLDPNKPHGFKNAIIIPTFHTSGENLDDVMSTTEYKVFIHLADQMRKVDGRLESELRTLHLNPSPVDLNDPNNIIKCENFSAEFQEKLFQTIIPYDISHPRYSDKEIARCFTKNEDSFKKVCEELRLTKRQLRDRIRHSKNLQEKYKWGYLEWTKKFNLVKEFIKKNDRLPTYDEEFNGIKIGHWLNTHNIEAEKNWCNGGRGKISDKEISRRKKLLKSINALGRKNIQSWNAQFDKCKKWISENKKLPSVHCYKKVKGSPFTTEEEEERQIAIWVTASKQAIKNNRTGNGVGKDVLAKRKKLLEGIGISFESASEKNDKIWFERFEPILNNFKEKSNATQGLSTRDHQWVSQQKHRWQKGILETWKIALLKKVEIALPVPRKKVK